MKNTQTKQFDEFFAKQAITENANTIIQSQTNQILFESEGNEEEKQFTAQILRETTLDIKNIITENIDVIMSDVGHVTATTIYEASMEEAMGELGNAVQNGANTVQNTVEQYQVPPVATNNGLSTEQQLALAGTGAIGAGALAHGMMNNGNGGPALPPPTPKQISPVNAVRPKIRLAPKR